MQKKDTTSKRKIFQWVGMTIIVLLIGNFGYQMYKRYSLKKQYVTEETCDIQQQSCSIPLRDNISVALDINPKPFHAAQTVNIVAIIKGIHPDHVSIFSFPLGQTPQIQPIVLASKGANQYAAQMVMPAVDLSHKKWVIMLVMQSKGQSYAIPFRFKM